MLHVDTTVSIYNYYYIYNYIGCFNLSGERVSTTNLRVKYLEQMVSRLDKEKKAMEEEFGRQRKKFMKEMVQAECT